MSTESSFVRTCVGVLIAVGLSAGQAAAANGLAQLPGKPEGYEVVNRVLTLEKGGVAHLSAAPEDGIAWLLGQTFTEGRISVEVRGVDVMQRSFVGLAFHGGDRDLFDVVYTRPFNFNAADAARMARALQYMSVPDNTWEVLREKFPGKYEAAVSPPPAAEAWVRLTLEIKAKRLKVFVNDASEPALAIDLLSKRQEGRVGLWVGNNSEGWFRNLTIHPVN